MTYTTKDLEKTGLTGVARREAQLAEEREQEMLEEAVLDILAEKEKAAKELKKKKEPKKKK
jgi:hypothetical protein|tara:strand:+ start:3440 stop:3622 length:183 start_codon:yes stop_codon:yes gene_type:complete